MPAPRVTRLFAALALLALAACSGGLRAAPTLTPDPDLALTAAALFPTPVPTPAPTPTPVARGDASEEIAALLGAIESAVLMHDLEGYLAMVDLSDPVFALEHTRWAEDWVRRAGLNRFDLSVRNLTIEDDRATGDLHVAWTTILEREVSRGADFPVRFLRGEDGRWRYAGEFWLTSETGHFRVHAAPGLGGVARQVIDSLPAVYAHVTASLGHTPAGVSEIKLYDNPWDLIATTRLSITDPISGWNEPGESLKLVASDAPGEATLAHEFTHFVMFDMAGTTRGRWPWWLAEGVSEYVASHFWTVSQRNSRLEQVQDWRRTTGLAAWESISVFETTPRSLWPYVYPQGYAFVRYVSETYGDQARNAWLRAMATEMDLAAATESALGLSFGALSEGFLGWLDAQG